MSAKQSDQMYFPNMKIIPLKYVLKFNPAVIGLIYKLHENDNKKRLYKIYLHGLINKNNSKEITQQLFDEHKMYLNQKYISFDQIQRLVKKLLNAHGTNKQNQKLSSNENPSLKKPTDKDKIFTREDQLMIMQHMQNNNINNNKKNDIRSQKLYQQSENIDHFDSLSADKNDKLHDLAMNMNRLQYEYDFQNNNNPEDGYEELDPDGIEYYDGIIDEDGGDDYLEQEENFVKMVQEKNQSNNNRGMGINKANFLKNLDDKDYFTNIKYQKGNLSD